MQQARSNSKRPPGLAIRNSLGMTRDELDGVLDGLDAAINEPGRSQRMYRRFRFRRMSIPVQLRFDGGGTSTFAAATRNISRGGLSFIHRAFVHPNTRCVLGLPRLDGSDMFVVATVMRCDHRSGMIHETGVRFDVPVDLRQILDPSLLRDTYVMERVDRKHLEGKVLHAASMQEERLLIRSLLKDTKVNVFDVSRTSEAMELLSEQPFKLLIADASLPDIPVDQLHARADEIGLVCPPILLTGEGPDEALRELCDRSGATSHLVRPFDEQTLLLALGEFLSR